MTIFQRRVIIKALIFTLGILSLGLAQGPNPFAPSSAMDTLNEAPVGGGLSTGTYLDRARQVGVAPRPAAPKRDNKQGGMINPEMPMYAEMGTMTRTPGRTGRQQPAASMATPVPTPKQIRVLSGSRVQCAVSGALLEDIVYKEVPETEKGGYYDDGSHGDAEAGDGTWTNITIRNDVMSPESHAILQRLMTLLNNIEETEPMDFYRLNVASSEPLSSMPKQIDEEQDRDIKMTEWNDRFLRMFRVSENDPQSAFYPIYIPPPPSYPNIPLPGGFQPVIKATPTPTGPGSMTMGRGMNITGEGSPGQLGNYYRRGGASSGGSRGGSGGKTGVGEM